MPRIEELPLPAQNEFRASRGDLADRPTPEKRRTSLLQRLAAVGLGRREEDEVEAAPEPRAAAPIAPRPAPAPRPIDPRIQEPVSEYAKRPPAPRPAPQGLDQHGRPAPVHNSIDEDQLEIPAFLRRQAN
jgi:cell division protein FtsZ